jgi:hypothetical protein
MPSDRIARALLRLYPREWRARYGDEFLALIADSGLSWREGADVIAAATVERLRAAVGVIRSQLDPTEAQSYVPESSFADSLREAALFGSLVCLTVAVFAVFGVPLPRWTWWVFVLPPGGGLHVAPSAQANWRERATLSYFWFVAAVAVTGIVWRGAGALIGVPPFSDRIFFSLIGVFFLAGIPRAIYCGIRILIYGSTWRGMHPAEIHAWRLGLLALVGLVASFDAAGETFWMLTFLVALAFRTPYEFTRHGAARRRAQFEASERFWSK